MTFSEEHPFARLIEASQTRLARAARIKESWQEGEEADAAGALAKDSELAADRALVLELAYEEYCTRTEAGELVDTDAFCDRFRFQTSLRRLIQVHQFLDDHPNVLDRVPAGWPDLGSRLGDFIVIRELGRGGFSRVFLATEVSTGGRPVAIKVTSLDARDARTLGPLSHPHLIQVLSSPTIGSWTIVAMPFVGAATLEEVIEATRILPSTSRSGQTILDTGSGALQPDDPPFTRAVPYHIEPRMSYEDAIQAILRGVFDGLAYLHSKGIAHRDLKPSNVLLGPTGHPYLLDFNLATTGVGIASAAGTLPYMAPEQLQHLVEPGLPLPDDWLKADIYAAGLVLFELLTGKHPFAHVYETPRRESEVTVATRLLEAQRSGIPSLPGLDPRVGPTLRAVLQNCLSFDPAERPRASDLVELLKPAPPRRRRRAWVWCLLIAVLLLLVVPPVWILTLMNQQLQADQPQRPPDEPRPEPRPLTDLEIGLTHYRNHEFTLAGSCFGKEGNKRQDGNLYACAAYCFSFERAHTTAEFMADAAIKLGVRTPAVYANRALSRLRIGKNPQGTKSDCDEAIRMDARLRGPRLTRAEVYLAMSLRNRNAIPPREALSDIEYVIAGGPNSPEVFDTAATLYVLSSPQRPELKDKAAEFVREAIHLGRSPERFAESPVVHDVLTGHPVYDNAMKLTPGPFVSVVDLHLVNPDPSLIADISRQ